MVCIALKSFVGAVCMRRGEQKDIQDEAVYTDLLRAGYVKPADDKDAEAKPAVKGEPVKRGRKPKASEG